MRKEQKYIRFPRSPGSDFWILGPSGGSSYLASQCEGRSGIEKDLSDGWIIRFSWEDDHQIVFILERNK